MTEPHPFAPTLPDVRAAAARIHPYALRTPVLTCDALNRLCDAQLFFKCENFQKVGAFKFRGACNAVFSLDEAEAAAGVATHSSGNHAQALALAARLRGIPAYVVMPEGAPRVKLEAVAGYGAKIIPCRPTLASREEGLREVVARTGAAFIHPYDDLRVIAGQGTVALELLADVPDLDLVTAPVGGGGLLSGTALVVSALTRDCSVVAAEPAGAADAARSLRAGKIVPSVDPVTIADGLLTSLGELTFPIIQRLVRDIVTVSEEAIVTAMRLLFERMKIVVEPSAAVPLGALLTRRDCFPGRRFGVILTGGNVDLDRLPWLGPDST
jgi:threonine dehydratase